MTKIVTLLCAVATMHFFNQAEASNNKHIIKIKDSNDQSGITIMKDPSITEKLKLFIEMEDRVFGIVKQNGSYVNINNQYHYYLYNKSSLIKPKNGKHFISPSTCNETSIPLAIAAPRVFRLLNKQKNNTKTNTILVVSSQGESRVVEINKKNIEVTKLLNEESAKDYNLHPINTLSLSFIKDNLCNDFIVDVLKDGHLRIYNEHKTILYDEIDLALPAGQEVKLLTQEFSSKNSTHHITYTSPQETGKIQVKYSKRNAPKFVKRKQIIKKEMPLAIQELTKHYSWESIAQSLLAQKIIVSPKEVPLAENTVSVRSRAVKLIKPNVSDSMVGSSVIQRIMVLPKETPLVIQKQDTLFLMNLYINKAINEVLANRSFPIKDSLAPYIDRILLEALENNVRTRKNESETKNIITVDFLKKNLEIVLNK